MCPERLGNLPRADGGEGGAAAMDGGIDTAGQSVDDARPVVIDKHRVIDRHRVRRKVGRGFWALSVVVPLALTAAVGWARGPQIEDALHAQAASALSGA